MAKAGRREGWSKEQWQISVRRGELRVGVIGLVFTAGEGMGFVFFLKKKLILPSNCR